MARYRGLTWDHPRGRDALEAAARDAVDARGEALIAWAVHPLEGFESSPIEELAAAYDVIVLDHPHLGDALAAGALQPLDGVFEASWLEGLAAASVGPSHRSYVLDGALWALPLDAATQVAASVPELVPEAPRTWGEVDELAVRQPVALSLAGPHALLSFASLCVALGEEPATVAGAGFVSAATGADALERMTRLARSAPAGSATLNPIGLLDRMRRERDIAYVPLVYGYVTAATGPGALRFDDAPAATPGGRRGSTIGGTGIALSARCRPHADLVAHLRWLLEPAAQTGFIPPHAGQPSLRAAWTDAGVNAAAGGFYRSTLATIEDAWVRPRVAGYVPFQSAASAILRDAIAGRTDAAAAIERVNALFDELGPASAVAAASAHEPVAATAGRNHR
ncbi:extracellular solute-binding protein [Agromyces tardus]|uniref:Extracellular solute-binding protein n=1 Tax=Agromyces tardus TaxID=2583849 RepID=A0A3M8AHQ1_9MICO|nr:extracellular solute-binding protein [Agromyces tardus]RNB50691.1 extracellular solute-binding protein [Agromyces tardus]